jgi:phosphoribosylamine---glycine ligase
VLPRLDGDLLAALAATARGDLSGVTLGVCDDAAVTVVLAGRDYPARGDSGTPISGVDGLVFHAGTAERDGRLVTAGGRILAVTGVGPTIEAARDEAYATAGRIHFDGCRFRTDIAAQVHAVA